MKAFVHATLLAAMMGATSFNVLAQETENVNTKTIRTMADAPATTALYATKTALIVVDI